MPKKNDHFYLYFLCLIAILIGLTVAVNQINSPHYKCETSMSYFTLKYAGDTQDYYNDKVVGWYCDNTIHPLDYRWHDGSITFLAYGGGGSCAVKIEKCVIV